MNVFLFFVHKNIGLDLDPGPRQNQNSTKGRIRIRLICMSNTGGGKVCFRLYLFISCEALHRTLVYGTTLLLLASFVASKMCVKSVQARGSRSKKAKIEKNEDKLNGVELDVLSGGVASFPRASKKCRGEFFLHFVH